MSDTSSVRPTFGFARRHGATIVGMDGNGDGARARVAHRASVEPAILAELRRFAGRPLTLESHSDSDYERLLRQLYEGGGDSSLGVAADIDGASDLDALAAALPEPDDLLDSNDDAPIIRLINALLTEAVRQNASDIHIEPFESRLLVRFRIDGVLQEVLSPKKAIANAVVSRIKVMAKLDIAEKRLPQDGRIGLRVAGRPVDVRVSTIPAGHGERVVMRLLDKQAGRLDLDQLGMRPPMQKKLDQLIHRPHGILLVTGPTGSGKTTTLYAALSRLNDATRNILTVEDPIEYHIDGIGQTQVNPKVDMTFARGLRAILRQDPDVVMVGEIRDLETAEIAVQASLTGHLVLSTLHTNSAIGAITRLRDMGIEPFLLSSSLLGVLSQRLVRQLDPETRVERAMTAEECRAFGREPDASMTAFCAADADDRNAGYRGRTGLYELIGVDEGLRELIHRGAGEQEMLRHVRQHSPSLMDDGWNKLRDGTTTVEEVLRVTRED